MNQPDNNEYDAQFDQMMQGLDVEEKPYGNPVKAQATGPKPGISKRGKVVFSAAGVVLAVGGFAFYQDHQQNVADQNAKAAAIQLQQSQLDLERLKVMNEVGEKQAKDHKVEAKSLQAKIDACVDRGRDGAAYLQGVVDACRDQYEPSATVDGQNMQEAGASSSLPGQGGDGANTLLIAGIGAAVLGAAVAARRGTRRDPA